MFVAIGVAFAVGAMNYSMGPPCRNAECANLYSRFTQLSAHPGAGYFPLGLSILLIVLGGIVLFKAMTIESESGDPVGAFAWRPLIVIVTAITVFGLALERFGLFMTIPVLVIIASFAGDEFKWKGVVVSAAVLTLFSWAVFIWGLKLTIPTLPWFAR